MASPKFTKGTSGNPSGRPKNKSLAIMMRKTISSHLPAILQMLINAAKEGDIQAAKILLDKTCPNLKPRSDAIEFNVPKGADSAVISKEIIDKMANGEITADDANTAMSALSAQIKIFDTVELSKRMDEFEARQSK